jgi:hypothetical protein
MAASRPQNQANFKGRAFQTLKEVAGTEGFANALL